MEFLQKYGKYIRNNSHNNGIVYGRAVERLLFIVVSVGVLFQCNIPA